MGWMSVRVYVHMGLCTHGCIHGPADTYPYPSIPVHIAACCVPNALPEMGVVLVARRGPLSLCFGVPVWKCLETVLRGLPGHGAQQPLPAWQWFLMQGADYLVLWEGEGDRGCFGKQPQF